MSRTRTRATNRSRTRREQPVEHSDSEQEPMRDERNEVHNDNDEEEIVDLEGQGGDDDGGDDDDEDSGDDDEDSDDDDDEVVDEDAPGALTPGQARPNATLRYQQVKAHDYLYRNATKPLNSERLYDCIPEQFFPFMKDMGVRGDAHGWTRRDGGILWIRRKDGVMINLLVSYGSISLKRIQRHERTYWNNGRRPAQDDRMLFECIMASLSQEGKDKVYMHSDDYMLKSGDELIPSGLCLLKVVVRESYLDSDATTGMIRQQLSSLDMFMPTVNNDITRFNNHVKMLLQALNARNERTLDLLTYLFNAYAVCNDKEFLKFIEGIQTDHDMGTKRVDAKELMSLAEKKYKIMKTLNKWEAPSQTDEKILALQVEIDKVQEALDQVNNKRKHDQGDEEKRKKQKKDKNEKKPEWFNGPPAPRKLLQPKEWNGEKWYYCCRLTGGQCDGEWRTHKPEECTTDHQDGKDGKSKKKKKEVPESQTKNANEGSSSEDSSDESSASDESHSDD